jgi:hypothetical protein
MAYKNKVYVGFDGDKDIHYYRLLTAWSNNDRFDFNLLDAHDINTARDSSTEETIKIRLRERFDNSKAFILLVGESTKYLYKFVKWEIETALRLDLPIIAINLNKKRSRDEDRCPAIVRDELAMHISFEMNVIEHAIDKWPDAHRKHKQNGDKGAYYYPLETYRKLGL